MIFVQSFGSNSGQWSFKIEGELYWKSSLIVPQSVELLKIMLLMNSYSF